MKGLCWKSISKWASANLLRVAMTAMVVMSVGVAEAGNNTYVAADDTIIVHQPNNGGEHGRICANLSILATKDYVMEVLDTIEFDSIVNSVTNIDLQGNSLVLEQSNTEPSTMAVDLSGLVTDQSSQNADAIAQLQREASANEQRFDALNSRLSKVGARAAALAALHPLDFDPSDKLNFAAGYGNYKGENAAAIGAFYRPNEKVMFSIAGTMSGQENMVNAGVSFSLDRTNGIVGSKAVMAREITELKEKVAKQDEQIAKQDEQIAKQEQQIAELVNLVKQLSSKAN